MKKPVITMSIIALIIAAVIIFMVWGTTPSQTDIKEGEEMPNCGEGTVIFYANEDICWQKSTMPGKAKNWDEANEYCENLVLGEKEDWRLPTVEELSELVEGTPTENEATINTDYFDNTEPINYWTSNIGQYDNSHISIVFTNGYQHSSLDVRTDYGVRCVRDIKILG